MRIAFVGKGGSGKTTMATLFASFSAHNNKKTLAIDADINQQLARSLGFRGGINELPDINDYQAQIKEYLKGDNKLIESTSLMVKTTPPGPGSNLLNLDNELINKSAFEVDGVKILNVGEFDSDDLALRCFHGKTSILELIMNHLADTKEDRVIMDLTAGADWFSSGLFAKFDLVCLVVEPTEKSLDIYEQFKKLAEPWGVKMVVVANKVMDQVDVDYVKNRVGNIFLGAFSNSQYIRKLDKGGNKDFSSLEEENLAVLKKLDQALVGAGKDWAKLRQQSIIFHMMNAESWMNERFGYDFSRQIDSSWGYENNLK
jgi:CO dehydrogenase maturation factor